MAAILAKRFDSQRGEREGEEDVTALLLGTPGVGTFCSTYLDSFSDYEFFE